MFTAKTRASALTATNPFAAALVCLSAAAATASGQTFPFAVTVTPSQSTANFTLSVSAPFAPAPSTIPTPIPADISYLIGTDDPAAVPPFVGTRTRPGFGFGSFTGNQPVPITSGSVTANGSNGTTPLRPTGSGSITFDTARLRARAGGLTLSLLGGTPISITPRLSISFATFRVNNPTCLVPGVPLSLDLPATQATSVIATQVAAVDLGTMTAIGPSRFGYSIPLTLRVVTAATLNGQPLDLGELLVPVTLAGELTLSGNGGTVTGTININENQVVPGPTPLDPQTLSLAPVCNGDVKALITLQSTSVTFTGGSSITAVATPGLDPLDYNRDGSINIDDISDFITAYFANTPGPGGFAAPCPAPNTSGFQADINRDCLLNTDDLSDFITAYFSV